MKTPVGLGNTPFCYRDKSSQVLQESGRSNLLHINGRYCHIFLNHDYEMRWHHCSVVQTRPLKNNRVRVEFGCHIGLPRRISVEDERFKTMKINIQIKFVWSRVRTLDTFVGYDLRGSVSHSCMGYEEHHLMMASLPREKWPSNLDWSTSSPLTVGMGIALRGSNGLYPNRTFPMRTYSSSLSYWNSKHSQQVHFENCWRS